jgi:hypothetical protein
MLTPQPAIMNDTCSALEVNTMPKPKCKNISPFVSVLTATILMVYLASCGPPKKTYRFYQGPQLPSDQTAQLACKGETIQINAVNGQKSPQGKDTFGNVSLEILPGDYHLTVSFSGRSATTIFGESYNYQIFFTNNSLHNVDITMKAEAGHTYLVTSNHDYEKSTWYAVVRDETDDRRILREGPYPLRRIRTGDNQEASRVYRN